MRAGPYIKWILKLAVAGALLAWVLSPTDLPHLWRLMTGQSTSVLLLICAMQLLNIFVATVKWRVLLPKHAFWRLFRLNLAVQFYSLVVPGQVGAEAVKAFQLGRGRADAEAIAASVVLDKVTGLVSLLVLGWFGSLVATSAVGQSLRPIFAAAVLIASAGLAGACLPTTHVWTFRWLKRLARAMPSLEWLLIRLALFIDAWCRYLLHPSVMLRSLGLGLVLQVSYIGMVELLSHQFSFSLPILEWCWIIPIVSLAAVLPITLAGIGVRESVFVGLLAIFLVPNEKALALSLSMLTLHLLFGILGGVYELSRLSKTS